MRTLGLGMPSDVRTCAARRRAAAFAFAVGSLGAGCGASNGSNVDGTSLDGTGGLLSSGGAATAGGSGGTTTAVGGSIGVSGSSAASASGGTLSFGTGGTLALGAGGTAGSGGTADASTPVTYPPLNPAQIGTPAQIQSTRAFSLAESPLWDPCGHQLLFVDVVASNIYSLKADGAITVFASNTNNANGIAFDVNGSLILAQMGGRPGHIARLDRTGKITRIDPPAPGGAPLHTPDDVIVRSDGTIYFTDGDFPPIGSIDLSLLPVYGFKPGAAMLSNYGTVAGPNGIELSPDEKTLYVDAYFGGSVVTYSVAPDGTLAKGPTFASGLSNPDSLCLDAAGNLYVGVSAGLQVFRPDGTKVALIPVPSTQGTTNCTFGGQDGKTLYISAWTKLLKVENMPIPGLDWVVNRKRLGCM